MRKNFKTVVRIEGVLSGSPQILRLARVIGGILFLILFYNPIQVRGAVIPPANYSVSLAWNSNPAPDVAGYRVYYGTASGVYSSSVDVGNQTTNKVSGLANGITYFFAVTCYDTNGLESTFSNETSYVNGLPTIQLVKIAGQTILTVRGLNAHTYEIQATENFTAWTVIGAVTLGVNGLVNFTDTNAGNFQQRFYRTRDTQP